MNPVENQEEINAAIERMMAIRLFSGMFREGECAQYLGITRTALSLAITRLVKRGDIFHPSNSRFVIRSRT